MGLRSVRSILFASVVLCGIGYWGRHFVLVDLEAFVKKFKHFSAIKMGLGIVVPFGFALVA